MADEKLRRFVILHHTGHGPEHWDLMLEDGEVLATWQLGRPPNSEESAPIEAIRIGDHRTDYLAYEGAVSRGRGVVTLFDGGAFRLLNRKVDTWEFELLGSRVYGVFSLRRSAAALPLTEQWVFGPAR